MVNTVGVGRFIEFSNWTGRIAGNSHASFELY